MSERRDLDYLADIVEAMQRVLAYVRGMSYDDFLDDTKTQDAVLRNVQVIGEAVKQLSPSLRESHPEIPWRQMAGLRDKITHDYFGMNYDIVWFVAKADVSQLLPHVELLLTDHEQ